MPKRRGAPSKAVPLTFILIALSVASRAGTTIPVTTTADDLAMDGNCTLREAVIAANTDLPVDRCPAGSGADTILLPAGTYVLSLTGPGEDASQSGDLDISSDVTIRGAGAAVTYIDGGSFSEPVSDRVIHILNGAGLTLSGVTVQGGVCSLGGGIFNAGRLFVGEGTIRNNLATVAANSSSQPGAGLGGATPQMRLRNTILANGADGDCQGAVISLGNNLDSDGSCGLSASSDLPATDAQLVPLSDNGGFTPTHALTEGSPAIDHIPTGQCGVATDQRGISRPQPRSGACDVGAYEFAPSVDLSLTIDTVRRLGREHRLTKTQRSSLLGFLKPALTSVTNGDEAAACDTLDAFSAEVSAYLGDGSVAPEDGRSLLDFADRIQQILCP